MKTPLSSSSTRAARNQLDRPRRAGRPAQSHVARLRIEHVPIDSIHPWEANPRLMSEVELGKLMRSIEEFGFVEPLVVRRADNAIIGGHQRWEAAKRLGLATVPVVYVDISEREAKALNLALNRISGEWDMEKLGALLEELQRLPDLDETLSGFSTDEIDDLLADLERQKAPDPREESFPLAAEALQQWMEQAPTRVSKGELWVLGRHRLLCGDSLANGMLDRLCETNRVDLVLTDPPYGIAYQSTLARRGRRKKAIANDAVDDFDTFLQRALPAIKSVMKRGSVLYWFAGGGGGEPVLAKALLAISEHFDLLNVLVWDKIDPGLGWRWRRSWEAIVEASYGQPKVWHGGRDRRNVLRFPKAIPQADDHPTPKPVPLLEEIIRSAAPAQGRVLDPFAGSGSALIAAERTGRTCLVAELECRYADIIIARWEALTQAKAARAG
jgi:ParB/RepB/Spo0J family partition protein